jgi:hypothetical protein
MAAKEIILHGGDGAWSGAGALVIGHTTELLVAVTIQELFYCAKTENVKHFEKHVVSDCIVSCFA